MTYDDQTKEWRNRLIYKMQPSLVRTKDGTCTVLTRKADRMQALTPDTTDSAQLWYYPPTRSRRGKTSLQILIMRTVITESATLPLTRDVSVRMESVFWQMSAE
jgi:hypothetical protein